MVHIMKRWTGMGSAPRRQHERAFKAALVERCLVPGASVAAIAMAGGINANLLFKWRRDHLHAQQLGGAVSSSSVALVAVRVATATDADAGPSPLSTPSPVSTVLAVAPQGCVRTSGVMELDIAGATLRLHAPVDETSLCSVLRALRQRA
jgi:transposase